MEPIQNPPTSNERLVDIDKRVTVIESLTEINLKQIKKNLESINSLLKFLHVYIAAFGIAFIGALIYLCVQISDIRQELKSGFGGISQEMSGLKHSLNRTGDSLNAKWDSIEAKWDSIEAKWDSIEAKLDLLLAKKEKE